MALAEIKRADRFPFLSSAGKAQLRARFRACIPQIASALNVDPEVLTSARELGCGNYGCTFLLAGLPADRSVLKVTSDNLEAHTVQNLLEYGEEKPPGIVKYQKIWRLGRCSILPRMRSFSYREGYEYSKHAYGQPRATRHHYDDVTGSYRPLWVIQREELPDVKPHFVGKVKELSAALARLGHWQRVRAIDWGLERRPQYFNRKVDEGEVRELARRFHAEPLMDALDWLMERGILFQDYEKIANLGWRDGTGLVIRDIGFAEVHYDYTDDPKVLGSVGELRRPRMWEGI